MNQFRAATILCWAMLCILANSPNLRVGDQNAGAQDTVKTKHDLTGDWISDSPLDQFVMDDSPQPVNTFRIDRAKDGKFKARYLGKNATSVLLSWVDETRQFEGVKRSNLGDTNFVVTQTANPDVVICEIEAAFNVNQEAFYHKDTWRRVRDQSKVPKVRETAEFILTESKAGLVAYNKIAGTWSKIDIREMNDGTPRLQHVAVTTDFASANINGELIGYCNRRSNWSKLTIPPADLMNVKVSHTSSSVSAMVGDNLYVLSAATGKWETPETAQATAHRDSTRNSTDFELAPYGATRTKAAPQADAAITPVDRLAASQKAPSDADILRVAERYKSARDKGDLSDPKVVEAKAELDRIVEESLDAKLRVELQRIAELKTRLDQLDQQLRQRIADRTAVIRQRVDELIAAADGTASTGSSASEAPEVIEQVVDILKYEDNPELTDDMKKETEGLVRGYYKHLKKLGFALQPGLVTLRVQVGMGNAHYYHNNLSIVMDPRVVCDKTTMRREYNHHALSVALGADAQEIFQKCSGIESGMADYLGCSACDDPGVGLEFMRVLGANDGKHLRRMDTERRFTEVQDNSGRHAVGEVLSGALWEMRESLGKDVLDRLLLKAWVGLVKADAADGQILRFARSLLEVAKNENPQHAQKIRTIFVRRGLEIPELN